MKEAERLFRDGKLGAAITSIQADLRSYPTDLSCRMFLFELLCFQGDYDRAWKQLDMAETTDDGPGLGLAYYKQVVRASQERERQWVEEDISLAEEEGISIGGTLNGEPFEDIRDADHRLGRASR